MSPERPPRDSRDPRKHPRGPREGPKRAPRGPQEGSKKSPNGPQEAPKRAGRRGGRAGILFASRRWREEN
eukprot:2830002-Pyramimonas_sp.AAC.1